MTIVKVTYSSACNAVRRRSTTDDKHDDDTNRNLQDTKNVPSTYVSFTVSTDNNADVAAMDIDKAETLLSDVITKTFDIPSVNNLSTAGLVPTTATDPVPSPTTDSSTDILPTLISIQSNQGILAAKIDSIETSVSAKIESVEATASGIRTRISTLQDTLIALMQSNQANLQNSFATVQNNQSNSMQALMAIMQSLLSMNGSFGSLENGIAELKIDTAAIISSVSEIEEDISDIALDVVAVESSTDAINDSFASLENGLSFIDGSGTADISAVKTDTEAILGYITGIGASISNVDTDVAAVKTDTEAIIGSVSSVENDITDVDTDVAAVKTDTEAIIGSVSSVETDIVDVDINVAGVKTDTEAIIGSVSSVETDISDIDADIAAVKNDTETIIDNLQDLREESAEAHGTLIEGLKSLTDQLIHSSSPSSVPSSSMKPSNFPSQAPSTTLMPSNVPSSEPSTSMIPSEIPSSLPSLTSIPSLAPSSSTTIMSSLSAAPTVTLSLQFSANTGHVCAVYLSKVQCAGENWYGECGLDPDIQSTISTPNTLSFPTSASPKKVVTGGYHTCTLFNDDTAMCNGLNDYGELGDGLKDTFSFEPVQVQKDGVALTNIADIAAGMEHTCVILNPSNEMYCFGNALNSRLEFSGEQNVKMMALSQYDTCIVSHTDETKVICKGQNLNDKEFLMDNKKIMKLISGDSHFCALLEDTTAKCFGLNSYGQLGNESTANSLDDAVHVLGGRLTTVAGITDINAGRGSTCLVVANVGSPWCFGRNEDYQLGIANNRANVLHATPVDVVLPSGKDFVSVHVGKAGHVVFSDNTVYSFGTNNDGILGIGSDDENIQIGDAVGEDAMMMAFEFN